MKLRLRPAFFAALLTRGGAHAFGTMTTTTTTTTTSAHQTCVVPLFVARGGALFSTTAPAETETPSSPASTSKQAYDELVQRLEAITHLSRAQAVLGYDQQVFMPSSASAERGAQLAALATVLHQQQTDPKLLELMDQALKDEQSLTYDQARLLELERKSFLENARIPSSLAAKAAELSASAYSDWVQARESNDFSLFSNTLQECFDISMQLTKAKQGNNNNDDVSVDKLYDSMLDDFEVGMSQQRIDDIFAQVETTLVPLLKNVLTSKTSPSTDALHGEFDIDPQQRLSEQLVKAIGFNPNEGRIDVSVHPFTSSMSPNDVRITSRFRTDEWYQGLAGSLHEGGHAIYEQSLPDSALSLDTALSMGTHESQSLFWERHVGLSKSFWKYATPILHENLPTTKQYSSDDIYRAINAVSDTSLIRVEADELSYPLHVILRYNIEKDVIAGKLKVNDIPQRWNDDMKRYLNVDVPSDAKGCLQDVHWSALAFGYFPTYLIGAIAAAQLFEYCKKDLGNVDEQMERGEFGTIKEWLTDKVHRHGRRYKSLDVLLEDQFGEPLNPKYFLDYLTEKYSELYEL